MSVETRFFLYVQGLHPPSLLACHQPRLLGLMLICDPSPHGMLHPPIVPHPQGTLCVMGHQPQKFDATRAQVLANLAEMMVSQRLLERPQSNRRLRDAGAGPPAASGMPPSNFFPPSISANSAFTAGAPTGPMSNATFVGRVRS